MPTQHSTLRILGFLCCLRPEEELKWSELADARFTRPLQLREVRVPCPGRMDLLLVFKALLAGADGVLVPACFFHDCPLFRKYSHVRQRFGVVGQFLPALGLSPDRFEYSRFSPSQGGHWQRAVADFAARVRELGAVAQHASIPGDEVDAQLDSLVRQINGRGMTCY